MQTLQTCRDLEGKGSRWAQQTAELPAVGANLQPESKIKKEVNGYTRSMKRRGTHCTPQNKSDSSKHAKRGVMAPRAMSLKCPAVVWKRCFRFHGAAPRQCAWNCVVFAWCSKPFRLVSCEFLHVRETVISSGCRPSWSWYRIWLLPAHCSSLKPEDRRIETSPGRFFARPDFFARLTPVFTVSKKEKRKEK